MTDRQITKLSISNLELLFSPPGLPLIDKGAEVPTTSVAIVGDAGVGKTTLGVCLAQAIAAETEGVALYLTTELAPTEIKYKVTQLGLEACVLAWRHRSDAQVGDLIGQHLALVDFDRDEPAITPRERALEAAWRLVEGPATSPPIRCVAIDAFPLPEPTNGSLRHEVVTLMQALEGRGVSVVIVQEASGATDFVPFVADIVFQLGFADDPDTGERIRKLSCPKSRFVRSLVGPHDTGAEQGRIMVWPDPLAVIIDGPSLVKPARVFIPLPAENRCLRLTRGALVVSKIEDGGWLTSLLDNTPGVTSISMLLGSMSRVIGGGTKQLIPDSGGAYSLAWSALSVLDKASANAVLVTNLESPLERQRFRVPFDHVLEALRMSGLIVCVHGPANELSRLISIAEFSGDQWRGAETMPTRRHRPAAAWIALGHWPCSPRPVTPLGKQDADAVGSILSTALEIREGMDGSQVRQQIAAIGIRGVEPASRAATARVSVPLHLLGAEASARARATVIEEDESLGAFAWAAAFAGRDWDAARVITIASARGAGLSEDMRALWAGLTAVHARSAPAIAVLQAALERFPALLDMLVRALAHAARWDDVEAAIAAVASRHRIDPILAEWIRADARLESEAPKDWEEADKRLGALIESKVPPVYRVAMLHNRGVAASMLGRRDDARRWWQKALELDPEFEISSTLLATE